MPEFRPIELLAWARSAPAPGARYDLGTTAMPAVPWSELGIAAAELAQVGTAPGRPQAQLRATLAERHEISTDEVALTAGGTHAAFSALAALTAGAGEVVIESPGYGPLRDLIASLGATPIALPRRASAGFLPEPDELGRLLTPRTRAVVLTDLHNPSGVKLPRQRIDELLDVVEQGSDAHLFVDEVYLEFAPGRRPPSAYRRGRRVVATRSTNKGYGMAWMRCGWALAAPSLVRAMADVDDYLMGFVAEPSVVACAAALRRDVELREHAAATARAGFARLRALGERHDIELVEPWGEAPAICFPRLPARDEARLVAELARRGVRVAPGAVFGEAGRGHVRLGCAPAAHASYAGAVGEITAALDAAPAT